MDNFDTLLTNALNPLHQHIIVAQCLVEIQEMSDEYDMPILTGAEKDDFLVDKHGQVVYPTIEKAGEAGMYNYLNERGINVVFANDLVSEIHGIDAIAFNTNTNKYIICESKGTVSSIKSKREYLAKTKDKGRQLSWKWCWSSICEMALYGPSAKTFLDLYKPYLTNNVERLLSVTSLKKHSQGYVIEKTTVFDETSLQQVDFLAVEKQIEKQYQWLKQIEDGKPTNL